MKSKIGRTIRHNLQVISDQIVGRRSLHLLHIGKTGGTALKDALSKYSKCTEFRIVFHSHTFSLMDVPRGEKVFFFLRDPYREVRQRIL